MICCGKCGVSCAVKPLQRVNSYGEVGLFWCEPCIEKHEPELHKNIQDDKTKLEKDLEKIIYK